MWQPVPWLVAGGKHPPELARLLAYAATGGDGDGGVVGSTDLKVQQLDGPANAVRLAPGAAVIPVGAAGAGYQAYLARNPEQDELVLTPTSSSGARTDLIIARVEDPQYPGTPVPSDPENGPYIFTRVIENVPSGTKRVQQVAGHANDSAITLARVTRPASTGTVLASHITDLRTMAQPRSKPEIRSVALVVGQEDNAESTALEVWPNVGQWPIDVPSWATRVRIIGTWSQVLAPAASTRGELSLRLGAIGEAGAISTQVSFWDNAMGADPSRQTYSCADDIAVPSAMRGTVKQLQMCSKKTSGSGLLLADSASSAWCMLDFYATPV